jgi:hypothetical protein
MPRGAQQLGYSNGFARLQAQLMSHSSGIRRDLMEAGDGAKRIQGCKARWRRRCFRSTSCCELRGTPLGRLSVCAHVEFPPRMLRAY